MITPTPGRVVHFFPSQSMIDTPGFTYHDSERKTPLTGHIAHVFNDRMINLCVLDSNGMVHAITSVTLLQESDTPMQGACYAKWMDYQLGQAARTHQAEAMAGRGR